RDMAHQEELVANLSEQLFERHDHAKASEPLGIGISWMCAGAHAPRLADFEDAPDRRRIAGMPAAGDGCARDHGQQVVIRPHSFAEIGIEIHAGHGWSLRLRRCACSTLTGAKATVSPALICANRSRSAEITVPIRG